MAWVDLLAMEALKPAGRAVVRHDGQQVLLVETAGGIVACANRCPHEGYPLSEGTLADGCILTCNWHNWKFDLASGETLIGGDRLTRFPVRVENGRISADLSPPDPAIRRRQILAGVEKALEDGDEQRLVRETARLVRIGADPVDAVGTAIAWMAERLELGTSHAVAAAPDWLALANRQAPGSPEALAAIGEILGHVADDARAARHFPYPPGMAPWCEADFLDAMEHQDEWQAICLLRGALLEGRQDSLGAALNRAALAHYADFGHAMIYTAKSLELAHRLGPTALETLLLMLVRSLVNAPREDLLPEFRSYEDRVAAWGTASGSCPPLSIEALRRSSAKSAMGIVAGWGAAHPPEAIFAVLVEAASWQLLHVDEQRLTATDGKIADNAGWLDFTHTLTFAEAGRAAAITNPALWPAVLLQLACFIGRNTGFTDPEIEERAYQVDDVDDFLAQRFDALLDHGRDRFIISAHLVKTLTAGATLMRLLPTQRPMLAAALNRLLSARMKGRHVLRTARQMHRLVAEE